MDIPSTQPTISSASTSKKASPRRTWTSLSTASAWENMWDNFTGPQAKAYHLLKEIDLGSDPKTKLRQAGQVIFVGCGGASGNSYTWVYLKDDVTVSLLQARLFELNLPINVEVCGSLWDSA
jgi:hypothetical protein